MLAPKAIDREINFDEKQLAVQQKLFALSTTLQEQSGENFISGIFGKKKSALNQPQSLYIYGSVGCGKTTLMQNFYNSVAKFPKIYFHFNSFMRAVHEALRAIRQEEKKYKDELIEAVNRVIKSNKLLCFDEFQVLDIADAMILGRIFSHLFSQKVLIVFTSNSHPLQLYKNGLQRELFLEFVNSVLLKNCEVIELNSGVDYRSLNRKNLRKRYFVSNKKNREEIKKIIADLTDSSPLKSRKLIVWGREVKIKKTYQKIAVIKFDDLCKTALAASDYQAICREFDLIFLLKLPILQKDDKNEARRFTLFIDEAYENKTALIILAKTKIDKIYAENFAENGDFSFKRTLSRLREIKSDAYWQESKFHGLLPQLFTAATGGKPTVAAAKS